MTLGKPSIGVSIGLRYAPMSLALKEGDSVFGNLKLQPILADLRIDVGFTPGGMAPSSNGNGARAFLKLIGGIDSAIRISAIPLDWPRRP